MKKALYVTLTLAVMLIISRFIIRIIDATVQIDDDLFLLFSLLVIVNSLIGFTGYKLYRNSAQH